LIGLAATTPAAFAQAPSRDCDRPTPTDAPRPPAVESNRDAKLAEMEKRIKELEAAKPPEQKPVLAWQGLLLTPLLPGSEPNEVIPAVMQYPGLEHATEPRPFFPDSSAESLSRHLVGMDSVFKIPSPDGQHALWVTGQVQADYHDYPRHGDMTDIDTFLVRRARLGIEAILFDYYEFRLLPDFGNGKVVVQDSFMNVHYWDEFQFMVGKFKEPVSYEELIFDRFVPTLERSLIDQLAPARDVGMMVHGENLLKNQLDYAVGVFNGEINGDVDTNKIHDFAGRIAWRPFNYDVLPDYLHLIQFGISGTAGVEQEALSLTGVGNETIRTPAGVPWLTFEKNAYANGIRTRAYPEFSYFYDQLGFMAEYLRMDQQIQSGMQETVTTTTTVKTGKTTTKVTTTRIINDNPKDIRFEGYQFTLTYLLTGEKRTQYSEMIRPLRPFDVKHPFSNPGAWEFVARVSHLQVDPSIFQSGAAYQLASPNGNSDTATEFTVGFNWYLNALVRVQFNWEHASFQQPLLLGPPSTYFRETDAAMVRFQIIF
jgi:phosphate-selective porin OprO/OprP